MVGRPAESGVSGLPGAHDAFSDPAGHEDHCFSPVVTQLGNEKNFSENTTGVGLPRLGIGRSFSLLPTSRLRAPVWQYVLIVIN